MKKECVEHYNKIKISNISILSSNKKLSDYERNLKLEYAREEQYESDSFNLKLADSRCNLGGWRLWFMCQGCEKKVGTLFYKYDPQNLRCRNCLNLTYEARQNKRKEAFHLIGNAIRLKQKYDLIGERLLRKGIHAKTRLRLWSEKTILGEELIEVLALQKEVLSNNSVKYGKRMQELIENKKLDFTTRP
ncbi:MAG: hypothetical protein AABX23_04500 [Nanoarchaeota archaeon]